MTGFTMWHGRLVLAGEEALKRLEEAPFTCIASFERSFYLRNTAGSLVCLGTDALEPGPINALCDPWRPDCLPRPGDRLIQDQDALAWPSGRILLGTAAPWSPPSRPPLRAGQRIFEPGRLLPVGELLSALDAARVATDLFPLFRRFLTGADEPLTPLAAAVTQAASGLAAWLRKPGPDRVDGAPPDIGGLLGLGPGLTPSGDDIIGGAMLGLCLAGRPRTAETLYRAVRSLPGQTNEISLAHLEMASHGQGAEAFHLFLNALMAGTFSCPAAARLSSVGHSSGWDMALGAVLALYSLASD